MMGREGQVFSDGSQVVRNLNNLPEFNASENFTRIKGPDGKDVTFSQPLDFPDEEDGLTAAQRAYQTAGDETRFSDPRADAPAGEVLDQIAMEMGMDSDTAVLASNKVRDRLAPVYTRNPKQEAVQMWSHPNVRQHVERALAAGDDDAFKRAIEDATYEISGLWESLGGSHPYLSMVRHIMPRQLRDEVKVSSSAYGRHASGSRLSDEQLETLRNANSMDTVNKVQTNWDQNVNKVGEIVADLSKKHPVLTEMTDMTTYRDLRRVYELADDSQKKVMDGFKKTFNLPDIDEEEALNLTMRQIQRRNLVIAHQKGLAKQLGLDYEKTPQGLKALAAKGQRAWREQALLSVRYHMANAMDMTVKSAVYGINPIVPPGSAYRHVELLGREMPRGVRVENTAGGRLAGLPVEAAGANDDAGVLTKVPIIGEVFKKSNALARGLENTVREAAFAQGSREHLKRNMPAFNEMLRRELGTNADAVISDLSKSMHGVSFSSQKLTDTILVNGGDARAASRMSSVWERTIDNSFKEGTDLSNLVHFDFGDERVIEEKLRIRQWAPFHFWATRNIPFYLDTLAANPTIMRLWQDYNQAAERATEEDNLPSRIKGMVPLPGPADKFLDTLFGPGRSYFNPLVVLSLADQAKPRYIEEDQPLLGKLFDKAQSVGLAPAPWFSYPLSALGVYGPEDEQMPMLRHSSILKNVTGLAGIDPQGTGGVDVEQPLRAVTNRVREVATGKKVQTVSGSAIKDYQISKVLANMSLELTGEANHPQILAAMRDKNHPLYQEALKKVQQESLLLDIQNFVSPIPHKRVTATEQVVRDRMAELPEGAMGDRDFRKALVESGDPAGAYLRTPKPKVLEPVLQDQYGNVQSDNTASSNQNSGPRRDTTSWGGDVWGPQSPPPFNNPTAYKYYLKRIRGGYISPEDYIQSVTPNR
jgi:hypothetical protein